MIILLTLATINSMSSATGEFTARVDGSQSSLAKMTTVLAGIDLVKDSLEGLKQATDAMSASSIALDSNMQICTQICTKANMRDAKTYSQPASAKLRNKFVKLF